jgi:4-hydroxythreonine-4-phosphate dehydrogenase
MTGLVAPLALTMGEPAGIGGEIALKAWAKREQLRLPSFFAIDDPVRLRRLAEKLGWNIEVLPIQSPEAAEDAFAHGFPVMEQPLPGSMTPGTPDPKNAASVVASIDAAVGWVKSGHAGAVVTNPIHKHSLYEAGFAYPGHTEYLATFAEGHRSVMMLACEELRAVPVTCHLSMRDAIAALDTDEIVTISRITVDALKSDFGIDQPHLMVAALNPHGGESGDMGREETDIIEPAVRQLKADGLSVTGPAPADSLFHERARQTYDAVICMYHDQAQIPLKTIDFSGGVNITLGLPFVRTSPDHGTAFEIAGMGIADESSLVQALKSAAQIAARRGNIGF